MPDGFVRMRWMLTDARAAREYVTRALDPEISGACPLAAALRPLGIGWAWHALVYENVTAPVLCDARVMEGGGSYHDLPVSCGPDALRYDPSSPHELLARWVFRFLLDAPERALLVRLDEITTGEMTRLPASAGTIVAPNDFHFAMLKSRGATFAAVARTFDMGGDVAPPFLAIVVAADRPAREEARLALPEAGAKVHWTTAQFMHLRPAVEAIYVGAYDGESYLGYHAASPALRDAERRTRSVAWYPGRDAEQPRYWARMDERAAVFGSKQLQQHLALWNSEFARAVAGVIGACKGCWLTAVAAPGSAAVTDRLYELRGYAGAGIYQASQSAADEIAAAWLDGATNRVAVIDASYWRDADPADRSPSPRGEYLLVSDSSIYHVATHANAAEFQLTAALDDIPYGEPSALAALTWVTSMPGPDADGVIRCSDDLVRELATNARVLIFRAWLGSALLFWYHPDQPLPAADISAGP